MKGPRSVEGLRLVVLRRIVARAGIAGWSLGGGAALLLFGLLWRFGAGGALSLRGIEGRMAVGFLVAAGTVLAAYPVLFRAPDLLVLRRLGVGGGVLFRLRAGALAGVVAALGVVTAIPLGAAGALDTGAASTLATTWAVAWGSAVWAFSRAAARTVGAGPVPSGAPDRPESPGRPRGYGAAAIPWDRELAAASPLVFAPLVVLLAGVAAGAAAGLIPGARLLAALIGTALGLRGARWFRGALPRFAGRAEELAWSPPPAHGTGGLVIRDGIWRLLPPRLAALRGRDAAVLARRRRWTHRMVAPSLLVSAAGLLRSRWDPVLVPWVAVLAAGVLLLQAGGVASLTRNGGAGGEEWIDRTLGVGPGDAFGGRWLAALGPMLVFSVLLALLWSLFEAPGKAWLWPAGGVVLAAGAALPAAWARRRTGGAA